MNNYKMWTWCPRCTVRHDHYKNENGEWICEGCGEINESVKMHAAINGVRDVANKYIERNSNDEESRPREKNTIKKSSR